MKKKSLSVVCACLALLGARGDGVNLDQGFGAVPNADKPWVYWWWLNGNVDKKTITRDLEAMQHAGIGGFLMFDARAYHDDKNHVPAPPSKMDFMGPEWRKLVKFSLEKADELGLTVSINLSSCAGALKGPWEVGDDAPKKLVWTSSEIRGPKFSYTLQKPEGLRFWDVALLAVKHADSNATAQLSEQWQDTAPKAGTQPVITDVVNLTAQLDKKGKLLWAVPKGRWTLLRFGCTTMPGHEFDVDILDPAAVEGHFNRMGKALLEEAGPLAGKTLTHFYSVSWEGAAPTWTLALPKEFETRRTYPLRSWLPVLAGFTVKTAADSERFHRDYFRTLGQCFRDNFYGKMQTLCAQAGLKWHSESGGPWDRKLASFAEADQISFLGRNDMPQGEFWFTGAASTKRQDLNRPQAMAAHIYGKRLAASEAFTHMVQHWSAYPAVLKPLADAAFCDGVNQLVWHTFTASPAAFGKPGIEYFAGTHINPNVTWFPQARPFFDYLGRCQFMLRQGLPVIDVAVYIGDKPYQHWGRGKRWSPRATLELPPGFNYDLVTSEVLLDRLTVSDGNLVTPEGIAYRMLVVDLDDETVPLSVLRRIASLRGSGVAVVLGQRKPQLAATLPASAASDADLRRVAEALWSKPSSIEDVIAARGLTPDCVGPFDFAHRHEGKNDIYFVAGQGPAECTFRVADKRPELWDPVTGKQGTATAWTATPDGRTIVKLDLPENGSTFVVFRTFDQPQQAAPPPSPQLQTLTGPWEVRFGRKKVTFDELTAWDKNADDAIKYFSGAAIYKKTFAVTADEAGRVQRLHLGTVKCLAQVRLNDRDLGVVWTAPWSLDIADAIKTGRNELEITVVNTWVNRLIGDAALPPEKRTTETNVGLETGKRTLKAFQGFASEDPLMTSGLLGPVCLELCPP